MPNMLFRGAFIRHFDVRKGEGGNFVRIHLTSSFSKPVCEAMDWNPDLPKTIESAKLEGRLSATNLILTPNAAQQPPPSIKCKKQVTRRIIRVQIEGVWRWCPILTEQPAKALSEVSICES